MTGGNLFRLFCWKHQRWFVPSSSNSKNCQQFSYFFSYWQKKHCSLYQNGFKRRQYIFNISARNNKCHYMNHNQGTRGKILLQQHKNIFTQYKIGIKVNSAISAPVIMPQSCPTCNLGTLFCRFHLLAKTKTISIMSLSTSVKSKKENIFISIVNSRTHTICLWDIWNFQQKVVKIIWV